MPSFDFRVVAPDAGEVVSKMGVSFSVPNDLSFAEEADVVILCPLPREQWARGDERVLDLVRRTVERGAWLLWVYSGAFTAAAAGVLDGRRATTHWMYADELARRHPLVDVDPDVLFVQDGRIITSAGAAASLHLLRQEIGAELTNRVARRMVVPPQRDGGQAQYTDRPLPPPQTDLLGTTPTVYRARFSCTDPVPEARELVEH